MLPPLPRFLMHAVAAAAMLQLISCGGDEATVVDFKRTDQAFPPSATLQGTRLSGNGAKAADWDPATCTDERHKRWVQSNLDEDYLFYRQAPLALIEPSTFVGSVPELFQAYTTRALPQTDRFSFVIPQAEADASFQAGTATSIGATFARDANSKQIRIAFVDPNGPAFAAGLRRGMQLQSVNSTALEVVNNQPSLSRPQFDALFASPEGTAVTLGVTLPPDSTETTFTLTTTTFGETPVLVAKVLDGISAPGKVGYLAHTSFITPIAETQLADAFKTFAEASVTDLVVDLRYNGGGYIFIAAQLAYMVAGAARSDGKTFEAYVFNDKRRAENQVEPFRSTITKFLNPQQPRQGESLRPLNLSRVFVLATGNTCSASEAFINALRGVDVEVVLVGSTTCGKPYGFSQENNCTLAYFPLEFEGRNQKGQGVPVTGLTPSAACTVTDDLDHALGDPSERMLSASLSYMINGACPTASATATAKLRGQSRKVGTPVEELEFTPYHRTLQVRLPSR